MTIPDSVTSIGSNAFDSCTSLAGVTIPNSVTSIGNCAFSGCTSLASVTIPNSVTSIGIAAFNGCSSLTIAIIPSSVTSIGVWTFENCRKLTIYGYADTTAQTYATENSIPFKALDPATGFADAKPGKYYYNAVLWAINNDPQITKGTDAVHFSPNQTCTRGQVVTFLYNALK